MSGRAVGLRRLLSAAALAALVAACGGGDERTTGRAPSGGAAGVDSGGTAVLAEASDLEKPHPVVWTGDLDGDLVDVMYMALTRGAWRNGRLVFLTSSDSPMALAWMYEFTGPDSTALRYRMRSALRWSDGRPITAHDVVHTYAALRDPRAASPRQADVASVDSVVAENDSTVVFHFARRYPGMLFASGIAIAPRHVFQGTPAAQLRTHPTLTDPTKLVVSGPFRIGAWRPGAEITLVPNPHFPVKPRLDRIVIRVVPEAATRLVELQTGQVDWVRAVPFDAVARLRQQAPNLRFASIDDRYWEFVAYNPRTVEAFRDPEVRRALGMAVDVPGVIRALQMGDFATPAAGPYAPIFRGLYDPRRLPPLPYQPDSARAVLEAKGWTDADGDGIREKGGRPLRFTLLTNAGNQRRADVSTILQRQWREAGVEVRLQQMEFNTVQDRQAEGEYEALLGSWGVALEPDISPGWTPGSPYNITAFADTAVLRLFEQAKAQPTAEAAEPLWREAAERIVAQQPYTWLYYYDMVVAMSDRLRGVRIDTYGAFQNAWEWWIPSDRQGARGAAPTPAADSN